MCFTMFYVRLVAKTLGLYNSPIIGPRSPFWQFGPVSLWFPLAVFLRFFCRRDSPIMHSSVPDEFKPVIFEAGRTIADHRPSTHAIPCDTIPCNAAIDSPGKIVLHLTSLDQLRGDMQGVIDHRSVQQKAFDFWYKGFVIFDLQTSIHSATPSSMWATHESSSLGVQINSLKRCSYYPSVSKHAIERYTIYRWFSFWNPHF